MGKKNDSMINRFSGKEGGVRLLSCIRSQPLVGNSEEIARAIRSKGDLIHFLPGVTVIRQGESKNDIYFLLAGSVEIFINERKIATRTAPTHFGEMALIDIGMKRTATVRAIEEVVLLRVEESKFTRLANIYPEMWRRISSVLSQRLQERSGFIRPPNIQSSVFIGSSSEAMITAGDIARLLAAKKIQTKLWTNDVFHASQTTIEDLIMAAKACDFAVIVLSPDDTSKIRGKKYATPRDNAIFELGLFMGALGRERTFVVVPKDKPVRIPTDLLGVTTLRINIAARTEERRGIPRICDEVAARVATLGPN